MPEIDLTGFLSAKPHRRYPEFVKIRQALLGSSQKARNFYETILADLIASLVRPGDTVVDVGANAGKHTYNFLRALQGQGKCISIEPNPRMIQYMEGRLRKNPKRGAPCELRNVAASDRQKDAIPFYTVPSRPAVSSLSPNIQARHQTETIQVPTIKLDDLATQSARISFVKIDVEGHEVEVLSGATSILHGDRPFVFFECNLRNVNQAGKLDYLMSLFETSRYRIFSAFGEWVNADTLTSSHPTNHFAYPIEREPIALMRLHSAILRATVDLLAHAD